MSGDGDSQPNARSSVWQWLAVAGMALFVGAFLYFAVGVGRVIFYEFFPSMRPFKPPNAQDYALQKAVEQNNIEAVRLEIGRGANPNGIAYRRGSRGHTRPDKPILHKAIEQKTPAIVAALIDAGADPNMRNPHAYQPPLLTAARIGDIEMLKVLLHRGADVHSHDSLGNDSLMVAPDLKTIRFWNSVDCLYTRDMSGNTKLMETRSIEVAAYLLSKGVDVNARNADGDTALIGISQYVGTADMVRWLLKHGANVDTRNKNGVGALGMAQGGNNWEIVNILEQVGAKR